MYICGIVCEYNPFHLGHRYQIECVKRALGDGETGIVCVMSGDFVQRGEAASFTKFDRARAAVAGGADLVLELPLPWSLSSAEGFARGAVGALGALGTVTHLAFGSESGKLDMLERAAQTLALPEFDEHLRAALRSGVSYAAARQTALARLGGEEAFDAVGAPNDILAVEYLKVLHTLPAKMQPLVVERRGAAHDSDAPCAMPSASFLRARLEAGEDIGAYMPEQAFAALQSGEGPISRTKMETALLSRLRFLPPEAVAALPDAGEGLHNRLCRAAHTEPTLREIIAAAATKRYPNARIRRMLMCAALGIRAGDNAGIPPYLRVLAANAAGLKILRDAQPHAALPIVTKPAKLRETGGEALRIFELGAAASDLCGLCLEDTDAVRGDRDWRRSPAVISD